MNDLEEADINLTPLIDVVFVILIMFIVVAPLLEKEEVSLAQAPPLTIDEVASVESQSPVTIHVRSDNTILLNRKPVSLDQLEVCLRAAYLATSDIHPQLFQDEEARFGTYQEVKNVVAKVGFETLDVILQP